MRLSTVLLLVFIAVLTVQLIEAARGRGGGRSGGSRSRGSSRSRSRGSSSKPKITKNTPIKATTVRSPVIVSQTKSGSRSSTFKKVLVGYIVYRYAFSDAPVYRRGYPMYGSYVTIPDKRAVRVTFEEESLLNNAGQRCLGDSSTLQTLRDGIDKHLLELNTTVKYKKTGETKKYYNDTISLEDINEQDFVVTTRARYNTTIVEGTSCTQVEKKIEGTMITLYQTNPNIASTLYINNKLLASVFSMFIITHAFQFLY